MKWIHAIMLSSGENRYYSKDGYEIVQHAHLFTAWVQVRETYLGSFGSLKTAKQKCTRDLRDKLLAEKILFGLRNAFDNMLQNI